MMINFYGYYNRNGLDKEEYSLLIRKLMNDDYIDDLSLIKHIVMKAAPYAYFNSLIRLKSRWVEAEPYIMKDPKYAYYYAKNVIEGRWIEAEPYLKEFDNIWRYYCMIFKI